MIEVVPLFMMAGLLILLGFFSHLFFERTRIPDVLILMSVGVVIGHWLKVLDSNIFIASAPFVVALALVIILFEGGINLRFTQVIRELPLATGFTLAVFILTVAFVTLTMNVFFGWSLLNALLLAVVVGDTSEAVVIPLISRMRVADYVKVVLTLESTLTDVLCIISAITIVEVINTGSADPQSILNNLLGAFSIAAFVAFIFGFLWIGILSKFHRMHFGYLLTIAIVFILYAVVEFSGGSGAIAAFVFGLMLGNSRDIAEFLSIDDNTTVEKKIKSFHEEVSFVVRTFFFIYLGLIFDTKLVSNPIMLMSLAVLAAAILARSLPTFLIFRSMAETTDGATTIDGMIKKQFNKSSLLISTMLPRGLAAAVLALSPLITGALHGVEAKTFTAIVVITIISTNIVATIGSFFYEKSIDDAHKTKTKEKEEKEIAKAVTTSS
jgi:cell volume regulation protein A